MEDMREQTHTRHYALYRQARLLEMGFCDMDNDNKPVSFQEIFEVKRSTHLSELQAKEEEVRQLFVQRVKAKEAELKENERELHARFEKLKKDHAEEKRKLEETRQKLEDEYLEFTTHKTQYSACNNTMTLGKKGKKTQKLVVATENTQFYN